MIAVKKGDRVSEYILEEALGRGGFGEVWRARHYLWPDREVAVKIPTTADAVKSLTNEGLIQSTLEHPGIAQPLGMDTASDPPYFITEYVPGKNLREVLRESGPLDPTRARHIVERILEVLEYAHSEGVIHQDIKPENIMITPEGDVKLTDFGLGQTLNGESILLSVSLRSESPAVAGTFPYIAPEIRDGAPEVDGRADLYSLGIVLFELLTGKRPVGGEVPSDLRSGLPRWCDEIFRGLYARRHSRFPDVAAVRSRLGIVTGEPPPIPAAKRGPRVTPLTPPPERVVSVTEALRELDLTEGELRHWIGRGAFDPVSVRGKLYLKSEDIIAFRAAHPRRSSHEAARRPSSIFRVAGKIEPPPLPGCPGDARESAGFLVRAIAMLLDAVLLGAVLAPISPLGIGGHVPRTWLLIAFLYFSLLTGIFGRTVGKAAVGVRVVRSDGSRLTIFDGFVRTINYLASLLPLGLGFLSVPFSRKRLGFHDRLCGTQVIYDPSGIDEIRRELA